MVGVLALIVFRAIYGVITNGSKEFGFETGFNKAVQSMANREYFEKAMRGEDPNQDDGPKKPS